MAYNIETNSNLNSISSTGINGNLAGLNGLTAQRITTGVAGLAGAVDVAINKDYGEDVRDILLDIFADSGSGPTGSSLGQARFSVSLFNHTAGRRSGDFGGISLSAYTNYWIVMSTDGATSGLYNYAVKGNAAGSYCMYCSGGGPWSAATGEVNLLIEVTPSISAPIVTTQAVSDITETTATGNGNVTDDGGATVTERGTCIGTSANPTTAGTKFTASGTTGVFTTAMTGLSDTTHYHVRAYAINSVGTSYGADVEFDTLTPPVAPTVTTQAVSAIAETTATGNGNVMADGGATVTERGTCIGTSSNPTTAGTKFTASGTTGAFTTAMTGLSDTTHYHVRAYAINSVGTSYGSDVEFDTLTSPWRFENVAGLTVNSADHKTIYAEELNQILDRLHDLDGLDPTF